MSSENPAYARPPQAQESAGLDTGGETRYADGRKVGEVSYRFGRRADVTRDMPGWYIADGTQPDLVYAGVNYGKPNLTGRVPIGANDDAGGAGTFPVGATGGSSALTAHTHAFTQPTAHSITQPVVGDHSTISHSANHSGTAVAAHSNHLSHSAHTANGQVEVQVLGGSGFWVNYYGSGALAQAALVHDNNHSAHDQNHTVTQPTAHADHTVTAHALTTNVALSNNHSGGAVGAVSGGAGTQLPPYLAVWPLIKIR